MKKLICYGDSLTFGLGVRHNQKWTALVQQRNAWSIVNQGVNGDTTGGVLARLQRLDTAGQPWVLIMAGSNDIFYSGTDLSARANMGAIIHQVRSLGLTPIVGIPPIIDPAATPAQYVGFTDFSACAEVLEGYCGWLKKLCHAFCVPFVDFRADFIGRPALLYDGLHPNEAGHRVMADRLMTVLEGL